MTQLSHKFDGGTAGVTIAAGSGSNSDTAGNNYFDGINVDLTGTPGAVAYSNAQVHGGTLSGVFSVGSVDTITSCDWSASRGLLTDDYCRLYVYLPTAYILNHAIIKWFSAALARLGSVTFDASRTISIHDAADNVTNVSSTTLALGQWHRIEAHHFASTTVSQITVRIFVGTNVEGVTPTETLTSATFASSAAQSQRFDFGLPEGLSSDSGKLIYFDDVIDGATNWVGPVPVAVGAGAFQ